MSTAGPLLRHRFETLADASAALAEAVAVRLRACVDERGRALLAVPGGTTPQAPRRAISGAVDIDISPDLSLSPHPSRRRFAAPQDEG